MPFELGARCFVDITFINPFNNGVVAATIPSVLRVGKDIGAPRAILVRSK